MIRARSLVLAIGLACLTATTALAARPPVRGLLPPVPTPRDAAAMTTGSPSAANDTPGTTGMLCLVTVRGERPSAIAALPAVPLALRERDTVAAGDASLSVGQLAALLDGGAVIPFGTIPAGAETGETAAALLWIRAADDANAGPFAWRVGVLDALRLQPAAPELDVNEVAGSDDGERIAAALAESDSATSADGAPALWDFGTVATVSPRVVPLSDHRTCSAAVTSKASVWRALAAPGNPAGATPADPA